jgi:hypothetical protein
LLDNRPSYTLVQHVSSCAAATLLMTIGPLLYKTSMNLRVPIQILDELADTVIRSTGSLDLASGEIVDVRYEADRPRLMGMPAIDEQYEFTSGVLSNDGKDVEFRIDVDVMRGQYFVSPSELLELKVRAAKLFAGLEGKTLLAASERAAAASSDNHSGDADRRLH